MSTVSDLEILMMAADLADRESMASWRSDDLEFETKADGSPVSTTDKLIERFLRHLLAEHRPDDWIIGEEEGQTEGAAGSSSRCWVVDPIDGTGSFVSGRSAWGTLIALEVAGFPVAGMVSMPALGRRWWGTVDDGAFVTDEPTATPRSLHPSDESDIDRMRWASNPSIDQLPEDERERIVRFDGCGRYIPFEEWTTYPALMVADGTLDLAVQFGQHWDHSALAAVVVAAGGTIRYDEQPTDGTRFAATFSNGRLDLN
jgi:histidinol-phosphatase